MIVWLSVFAFAYGMGDSVTNTGYATMVSKLGMAIPAAIVVCLTLFAKTFDLASLYRISFLFMLVGLSIAMLASTAPDISQILMSAANESYCALAFTIACISCHYLRQDSALYCGLIAVATLLFTQAGETVGGMIMPTGAGDILVIAVIALIATATALLFREREFSEQLMLDTSIKTMREEDLLRLALERGLTPREQNIFLLLVRGKTTTAVSDELFISQSAVRSHSANIYQKFGVHSRQEFDELVARP